MKAKKLGSMLLAVAAAAAIGAMSVQAAEPTYDKLYDFEGDFDLFEIGSADSGALAGPKMELVKDLDGQAVKMSILNDGDYTQKNFMVSADDKSFITKDAGYTGFAVRIKWDVTANNAVDNEGNPQYAYLNIFGDQWTQSIFNCKTDPDFSYLTFYRTDGTVYKPHKGDNWANANYPFVPVDDGEFDGWIVVDLSKGYYAVPENSEEDLEALCSHYNGAGVQYFGFGMNNCKAGSYMTVDNMWLLKADLSDTASLLKMLNNGKEIQVPDEGDDNEPGDNKPDDGEQGGQTTNPSTGVPFAVGGVLVLSTLAGTTAFVSRKRK